MRRLLTFFRDNARFAAAVLANLLALFASVWWLLQANLNSAGQIEIEPIVTCIGLTATLLGLNFVNDKLTKPHIRVRLDMSIAKPLIGNVLHGISVTLENHSIQKAFVKSYKIKLPKQRKVIQFLFEGFTGQPIVKAPLEPGQAFSFNIVMKNLKGAPDDLSEYGELIVTTDIGYEFKVPATIVREHVRELRRTEA